MSFNGNEGGFISLNDAAGLTANYRSQSISSINGLFFGKNKIQDLLNQTGAEGIRFYFGLDSMGSLKLVAVAADSSTDDILDSTSPLILDQAIECPTSCGSSNDLNS
jgi:hypothetical protein